jgi:hypothetical protein
MNEKEILQFFECLGEIWRDITATEFLMRCAIAKKDGDIFKFPQPPYIKGKIYKDYPDSFSSHKFETITSKFNKHFPAIQVPQEFIDLRHAMAHGIISQINSNGIDQLIKFKETSNPKELKIEFSLPLEAKRLAQLRQSLKELRRHIMKVVNENEILKIQRPPHNKQN